MELVFTDDEARILRDFLHDHLQELQFEVARTEHAKLRHVLLSRQDLIERLLAQLNRELRAASAVPLGRGPLRM